MATDVLHARSPAAWVAVRHWMYRRGIKSASGLTLPDFLGIGAQKAGTTWLHRNLQAHPQIFMPSEAKEVHFFDKHCLDYGLEGYASLFRDGFAKTKGEITPAYSILSRRQIGFIHAVMPRVKMIFLMRNPIERAWSHALMELLTQTGRTMEHISDEEFLAHFHSPPSIKRGDYRFILDNWTTQFSRKQIFTGFFDDLVSYPRRLLVEIFQFLHLSHTVNLESFPFDQVFHKGPEILMPPRFRPTLLKLYDPLIQRLAERYDVPAARWLSVGSP